MGKNTKTPVSIRLSDSELELLEQAAALCDGNKTKALVMGLNALIGGHNKRMTKEQLIAEITRRIR
jgi:hypothetical protein